MNTRSALTTRGWLICTATGLLLMGPAISQAQTKPGSNETAKPNAVGTESTPKSNPLFSAVKRELKKLLAKPKPKTRTSKRNGRLKSLHQKSKSLQQRQAAQKRPGLLPFLRSPKTDGSPSQVRKPSIRPVVRQVRRPSNAVPKPTVTNRVQQTAATQRTAERRALRRKQGKKTGLLARFLSRKKSSSKSATQRRPRQTNAPAAPVRPLAFRNIPKLFPKFLQPKSLPRTVSTQASTRPPTRTASRTSATISLNSTTTRSTPPTDFEDPFTEVSESEADGKKANPFTGLKLEPERKFEQPMVGKTTDDNAAKPQETTVAETTQPDAEAGVDISNQTAEADSADLDAKLKRLADRADLSGLQGFCPVMLRDHRELADTDPEFTSTYNAKEFQFSSDEAKAKFDGNPAKYAPIHNGHDVIVLTEGQVELEGSLENAVWFKDRLYLFSSNDTLETFVENPVKYTVDSDSDESKPIEETEAAKEDVTEEEATKKEETEEEATEESKPDVSDSDSEEIGFD